MLQKGSATVLIILLLTILVIGGGYLIAQQNKQSSSTSKNPIPVPSLSPVNETAAWKTYTNEAYGYSIKYPPDWANDNSCMESTECVSQPPIDNLYERYLHPKSVNYPDGIILRVTEKQNSPTSTLETFKESYKNWDVTSKEMESISVDGNGGFKVSGTVNNSKTSTVAIFENKNSFFELQTGDEKYVEILNQMLSIFKSTNN